MTVYFVSLGCDKNLVDSEKMLALLQKDGYEIVETPENADVIIVNTCSFILDAKEESIETIIELSEYKKACSSKKLIVTGCLAQRYSSEILDEIEEVDAVVGTTAYDEIVEVINSVKSGEKPVIKKDINYLPANLVDRVTSQTSYTSYLKISEGCNKNCSYCIIPSLRGRYRSVPMDELIKEAQILADKGTKELILVAQETTVYGMDLYKKKSLPKLLEELSKISGIVWIRILYCYPEEITDELLYTIRDNKKICKYLDIPIQHCSDNVLKRMGRKTNKADLVRIISNIRKIVPDICIRTTLISGFPGETIEEHDECVDFVVNTKFDRLGVFPYSAEEGTKAAKFDDQIDDEIKNSWADEIMRAQQEVVFKANEELIGTTFNVIVDGYYSDEDVYVARTYKDAPDIDGCVFFSSFAEIVSGSIVKIKVTDAKGYDLIGEIVE